MAERGARTPGSADVELLGGAAALLGLGVLSARRGRRLVGWAAGLLGGAGAVVWGALAVDAAHGQRER